MSDPNPKLNVTLNGKAVDLNTALPFTFKDLKALKKDGCDLVNMRDNMSLEHLFAVAKRACQKANPEITEEDVEDLSLPVMSILASVAFGGDDKPDRPT